MSGKVKVTFYELIVPGRRWDNVTRRFQDVIEVEVPPNVSVLDCFSAHFDERANVWRVLVREYRET